MGRCQNRIRLSAVIIDSPQLGGRRSPEIDGADRVLFANWLSVARKLEALVRTRKAESISADRYDTTPETK
jgi:hypothetical protein